MSHIIQSVINTNGSNQPEIRTWYQTESRISGQPDISKRWLLNLKSGRIPTTWQNIQLDTGYLAKFYRCTIYTKLPITCLSDIYPAVYIKRSKKNTFKVQAFQLKPRTNVFVPVLCLTMKLQVFTCKRRFIMS